MIWKTNKIHNTSIPIIYDTGKKETINNNSDTNDFEFEIE